MRAMAAKIALACALVLAVAPATFAQEPANPSAPRPSPLPADLRDDVLISIRPAETALMISAIALLLFLIPGIGLFYGGMVRRKNVLSAFLRCFIVLGVVAIQWVVVGYSLAFGDDAWGGFEGGLGFFLLRDVGLDGHPNLAPGFPHQLFMILELILAALAPAIISGAIVERMKFSAYVVFCLLWTTLVYDPVAHWVWAPGGWIRNHGGIDYGGGLVVHLTSGTAALVCAMVLGKRKGLDTEDLHPHNLTLTAIGTALFWVGWMGWSVAASRGIWAWAAAAVVSTILAGSAGIASWTLLEFVQKRKVTLLGACTGALAGLVAVTPAAGLVDPFGALLIGLCTAPLCAYAISLKAKLGYDDSLDVSSVHGIGGLVGVLAVGVLASPMLTGTQGGLLAGHADLLFMQGLSALAVVAYTAVATLVVLLVVERVIGLRVSGEDEDLGMDLAQHGQRGYIMGEGELVGPR